MKLPFAWRPGGFLGACYLPGKVGDAVTHVRLSEPFTLGRFTRAKDDLLCRRGVPDSRLVDDGAYAHGDNPITCPPCLAAMARFAIAED